MNLKSFITFASFLLIMAAALFPELTWAQNVYLDAIPEGDKSKEIFIDSLFGPLPFVDGPASPISNVVTIFNQAMLFVGGILVAYTLIAGTMSTAHDGEAMGKKWSSVWVPIRTALGTAAILPALPGGFCFAQAVVVWLAMVGVGLANLTWNAYLGDAGDFVDESTYYSPPGSLKQIRSLLDQMLHSNVCVLSGQDDVDRTQDANILGLVKVQEYTYEHGVEYGPMGVCGKVLIQSPRAREQITDPSPGLSQLFDVWSFEQTLYEENKGFIRTIPPRLAPLAAKIVQNNTDHELLKVEIQETLDAIALEWSNSLKETAQRVYKDKVKTNMLKTIKDDGWVLAGAWYMQIAQAQDAITRGVTSIPSAANPALDSWIVNNLVGLGSFDLTKARAAVELSRSLTSKSAVAGQNASQVYEDRINKEDEGDESVWASRFISWFINDDFQALSKDVEFAQMNQNPVMMARNLGQNLTLAGWLAFFTGGLVTSLFDGYADMLTLFAGSIIVSGGVMSTYIPMLPYILWIGVVLGWAILLVEATIAAPLWAVTHLAPDGDGVVGRGGQGYMLILSLVLRPALMVIGFVAAILLMKPLGYLINTTFVGAFISNVSPTTFGITQLIVGCVLYCVVMITMITRVFALIHVVPDRLLRWIGGGGSELGQEAEAMQSDSGAKVYAAAQVSSQLGQGMTRMAAQARSNRLQKEGNKRQDLSNAAEDVENKGDRSDRAKNDWREANQNYQSNPNDQIGAQAAEQQGNQFQKSAFEDAVSNATLADKLGSMPGASKEQKQKASLARDFLSAASKINSNSPDQVSNFISQQSANQKHNGTEWGNIMKNAQSESGNDLAAIRSQNRQNKP